MAGKFQYGGQAVIEGVMMRGRKTMAVAVRRPDNSISVHSEPVKSLAQQHRIWCLPFLRGMVALIDSFSIGMKALMFSADEAIDAEEEEKGKGIEISNEKDNEKDNKIGSEKSNEMGHQIDVAATADSETVNDAEVKEKKGLSTWETILTVGMAMVLVIVLFVLLPLGAGELLKRIGLPPFVIGFGEALVRALLLLGYIRLVTLIPDIQRVFAYHGAEHKVIHTYEAGEELTVDNARTKTTLHPRCGTSFLFYVVLVSAVVFTLIASNVWYVKILLRIALLPVVTGISYEIIKLAGKSNAFFLIRWLGMPGLWLQKMTTREPDDSMVEVAIAALNSVLADDQAQVSQA